MILITSSVIAAYQQKTFELFNQNIVYETQITTLKSQLDNLTKELENNKSNRRIGGDLLMDSSDLFIKVVSLETQLELSNSRIRELEKELKEIKGILKTSGIVR